MSRTINAKKHWFPWLAENCLASSGKDGSLWGMRHCVWGDDAYVVRCCRYLFMVSKEDFEIVEKNL